MPLAFDRHLWGRYTRESAKPLADETLCGRCTHGLERVAINRMPNPRQQAHPLCDQVAGDLRHTLPLQGQLCEKRALVFLAVSRRLPQPPIENVR